MSLKGIKRFAKILSDMQTARYEILHMATNADLSTESAHQDLRLSHLIEDMKDSVKSEFNRITLEKISGKA